MDLFFYLPCNFLSTYYIDNYGLRFSMRIGSALMLIGSALRVSLRWTNIWVWLAGHLICACTHSFLRNPVSKLVTNWFGDKEVILNCAITVIVERTGNCSMLTRGPFRYYNDPRAHYSIVQ
jgi:hypothetical protein